MGFRNLHLNIKIRIILQFVTALSSAMVIPYLSIYFEEKVGATVTGVFLVAIILSGVAGAFVSGFWADRIGRKKVMIWSDAGAVATFAVIALLNSPWYDAPYLTGVLFMMNMFAVNMFFPANYAMIVDCSTPESRKLIYTLTYWANNLALAIGGIVGAFLFEHHLFELFIGVAVTTLASLVATVLFISESFQPKQPEAASSENSESVPSGNILANYLNVLKDRTFMLYFVATVLTFALEHQITNYIGIRLKDEMAVHTLFASFYPVEIGGVQMLGILRTENTLLVVLLAVVIGKLMKRFADSKVLVLGIFLFSVGVTMLGFLNGFLVLILAMLFVTIGELMYVPIKQMFLADLAPAESRSSYMAVDQLTQMGAMMLGALGVIVSSVLSSYMMSAIYLVMGLTGMVLFRRILPSVETRRKIQQQQQATTSA